MLQPWSCSQREGSDVSYRGQRQLWNQTAKQLLTRFAEMAVRPLTEGIQVCISRGHPHGTNAHFKLPRGVWNRARRREGRCAARWRCGFEGGWHARTCECEMSRLTCAEWLEWPLEGH